MRWVLGFLVIAGLAAAGSVAWFLTSRTAMAVTATSGRHARMGEPLVVVEQDDAPADVRQPEPSAESSWQREDTALARLRAEIEHAGPVQSRSDEERLAEARAWVQANRPAGRPYNELEARMLALIDAVFDGRERSALWAMNTALIEVEMVRALDANGDGAVTDDEVRAFADENITILGALEHPFIRARLASAGRASEDEQAAIPGVATMQGALAGVLERAQLERWDEDLDGELSEEEIETGSEAAQSQVRLFSDGHFELVADADEVDPAEQQAVKDELAEKFGAEVLDVLEQQKEAVAAQAMAQSLMDAMRVENMDPNELRAASMKDFPQPPEQFEFDTDGDGLLNEAEEAAFAEATGQYEQRLAKWNAQRAAAVLQMEFNHALSQSDSDGDGRMSDREWDTRIDRLLIEREQRLFLRSYDLDKSGRVDPSELNRYLDWHQKGSLRADANFDGVVDARDLQKVQEDYIRQGR